MKILWQALIKTKFTTIVDCALWDEDMAEALPVLRSLNGSKSLINDPRKSGRYCRTNDPHQAYEIAAYQIERYSHYTFGQPY